MTPPCDSSNSDMRLMTEVTRQGRAIRRLETELSGLKAIVGLCAPPDGGKVDVVTAEYDAGTQKTSLAWLGTPGEFYAVEQSTNLSIWVATTGGSEVQANETAGELTEFETPAAAAPIYYRVRRLPSICRA